ncbi:DDB1- and CUL4-associated factor 11 [Hypsibius exemplaris]|uniref:DDB1- and CUL4-associated factor 11 n=1 Tax=Hypsibius exemplaris TaxID=2072580 RepID=A0A9X6NDC8_HYPEX|nr:DDB1- and CUL4-associated factor 11 [Hypsibius exemplaris]
MGQRASRDSDGSEDEADAGAVNDENDEQRSHSRRSSVDAAAPAVLEPRRHQGERGIDLLSVLEDLYRTGQLRVMPGNRMFDRHPPISEAHRVPRSKPDTTVMDRSDFKKRVLVKSGDEYLYKMNVPYGDVPLTALHEFRPLRQQEKIKLGQHFIPNSAYRLLSSEEKLFCGLHSQDGNLFMTSGQDQAIRIYDTTKACTRGKPLKKIRRFDARDVGWSVLDVRLSTCNRYVAYSSWSDSLHLATVHDDSSHVSLQLNPESQHCGIFSLMFSHDDTEILAGGNHGDIYIVSLLNGRSQRIASAHADDVNTVAFADQTSHILYSGGDDGIIRVWDRRTLSEERPKACGLFLGHKHGIVYLDPHSDGRHLLSNSKDQLLKIWDLRCLSPADGLDEAKRAVGENRWDYRYRMKDRICPRKLKADRSVITISGHNVSQTLIRARFSPYESTASRFVYTGDGNGYVYVFDALTGEVVQSIRHHDSVVRDVSWHPSRPELISTGWDHCLNLWTYSQTPIVESPPTEIQTTSDSDDDL